MGATAIGVFAYQSGWQRCNDGTPTGFRGVYAHNGSGWQPCITVETYQSGWQYCWVTIDGELNVGTYSRTDFDLSPYSVAAGVRFHYDGDVETRVLGGSWTDNSADWRLYDNGRDYQLKSETPTGSSAYIVDEPTRDTWLNFTSTNTIHTWERSHSSTGFLNSRTDWVVRVREQVSAPSSGNDSGVVWIRLEAEF